MYYIYRYIVDIVDSINTTKLYYYIQKAMQSLKAVVNKRPFEKQ